MSVASTCKSQLLHADDIKGDVLLAVVHAKRKTFNFLCVKTAH